MHLLRHLDSKGQIQYAAEKPGGALLRIEGDIFGSFHVTDQPADVAQLLAPVEPTQILCIGLNYKRHAEETGAKLPERPVLFVKGINSLQHPGLPILLPRHLRSDEVDYECELAVVIGKPCKNATLETALDFVLGYTCANDVSARDHQIRLGGGQWCRGKFFDTFAPLGPRLATPESIPNPNALRIRTELNGETVQDSNTSDMAFGVRELIAYLSASTTLPAGTVILTGTPSGVGMAAKPQPRWLRPGDVVTIDIEGIGRLTNPVAEESH
jgi:2-keto-4-pentenoate hydratase/2-oxohepta-3-ene-1,7-dioic acid hydratase in catechol pathway